MLRRIVSHAEYQTFLNAAQSCRLSHFFIPVLFTGDEDFAYGITITGKIGNAVLRNRLKRRIKAWFFQNAILLPKGVKINLIARSGAAELTWTELCAELTQLANQLKR